jgi:hypothetical protein
MFEASMRWRSDSIIYRIYDEREIYRVIKTRPNRTEQDFAAIMTLSEPLLSLWPAI